MKTELEALKDLAKAVQNMDLASLSPDVRNKLDEWDQVSSGRLMLVDRVSPSVPDERPVAERIRDMTPTALRFHEAMVLDYLAENPGDDVTHSAIRRSLQIGISAKKLVTHYGRILNALNAENLHGLYSYIPKQKQLLMKNAFNAEGDPSLSNLADLLQ